MQCRKCHGNLKCHQLVVSVMARYKRQRSARSVTSLLEVSWLGRSVVKMLEMSWLDGRVIATLEVSWLGGSVTSLLKVSWLGRSDTSILCSARSVMA